MRHSLLFKLVFCYMIVSLSMFILLNTFGLDKMKHSLVNEKKTVLYKEAELISSEYMTNFYKNDISNETIHNLKTELRTIDTFLDARIWIVNKNGKVIVDTRQSSQNQDIININEYDPNFLNDYYSENITFQGLLPEPMLSLVYPVNVMFDFKGYIVLHTSMSNIKEESIHYTDIINICYLIFSCILALIFIYIYLITVRPLKHIILATKEYTLGHFDYPLNITSNDEYRDLCNGITYMVGEMNNLDDYQKKFVANISHDFRSPLTSIKGYVEAILDGTIPVEMQDKYLNIISFETDRLTKLTTNLLELNSFENNASLLNIAAFDINAVIKQTSAAFEGSCTTKKIILNLVFSDKELFVDADFDKIQQVLYNLLDNAIKFSHNNSKIKITTEEKNDKVIVSIKDNGIGIPKDSINKVWERFYKTDVSRGKDKKGTGLGLSITKEIINAHGENINVTSTEGVGTEFIFTLSRHQLA